MTVREWGRRALVLLVIVLPVVLPLAVGAAPPATQAPRPHSEPKLGRAAAAQSVTVALPLATDTAALDAFLARVYDPQSPDYHRFLTPAEFTTRFVDATARQDAVGFLRNAGLTVHDPGTGATVSAEGAVTQMERAFSVQLDAYQAADGRAFIAPDRAPALPPNVAARVRGVIGLDTSERPRPHLVPADTGAVGSHALTANAASGCSGAVAKATNAFTPNQLATAYNFDTLYNAGYRGEGQTVALFELADYGDANVATWKSCFGINTPVSRVPVDGGCSGCTNGQDEVELDIDVVLGLAPQLSQVLVYEAPGSTATVVDTYQRIANDNAASVVSTSWGVCEPQSSLAAAEYNVFAQMAGQGMTVFAASGDAGSTDCHGSNLAVDDPASQPYVSGVGGTHLTVSGTNAYAGESVWNTGDKGGSGGGCSTVWPLPSWYQSGPGVTNIYCNGKRQVPDVAANGDPTTGFVVYIEGAWKVYGGTSASAPLWAAGTALVNQQLTAHGAARVGFGNPVWYRLLTQTPAAYHDVTAGNNCIAPSSCGTTYPATAGYDQTTGVGTPNFGAIVTGLLPPPPASVSAVTPNTGPYTGGSPVTITGANFRSGVVVRFGYQVATVSANTGTALSVLTPAQAIPGPLYVTVQNPGEAQSVGPVQFVYINPPHASGPTPNPAANPAPQPKAAPGGSAVPLTVPAPQPVRH